MSSTLFLRTLFTKRLNQSSKSISATGLAARGAGGVRPTASYKLKPSGLDVGVGRDPVPDWEPGG